MLGNRVKELRLKNNMTQEGLANMLGVSHAYIGLIEKGKRNLSTQLKIKLAQVFKINPQDLLEPKEAKHTFVDPEEKNVTLVPKAESGLTKPQSEEKPLIVELVQSLYSISDKNLFKDILHRCMVVVEDAAYGLLTPYQSNELKPIVLGVKRTWCKLVTEPKKVEGQELKGYILQNETRIWFGLLIDDTTVSLNLLHNDRKQVTLVGSWLDNFCVSYPTEAKVPRPEGTPRVDRGSDWLFQPFTKDNTTDLYEGDVYYNFIKCQI